MTEHEAHTASMTEVTVTKNTAEYREEMLTSSGELHQHFGQGGREQGGLPGVRKAFDDFLELLSETHLKEPGRAVKTCSLVWTHHLHSYLLNSPHIDEVGIFSRASTNMWATNRP